MRLRRRYGAERLEAACQRAVLLDACSYQSIKSMLATATDRQPLPRHEAATTQKIVHENLRGRDYYLLAESAGGGEGRETHP